MVKKKKLSRLLELISSILMISMLFNVAGCKKADQDTGTSSSATKTSSASAAKTTAGGTAKSTAKTTTSESTSKASQETNILNGEQVKTGEIESEDEDKAEKTENEDKTGNDDLMVEEKVIDLGGRVIDIELIHLVRIPTEDNPVESRQVEWHVAKELEKKYNCVFNYMAESNNNNNNLINSMTTNALAGTETREVLYVSDNWIIPKLVEGAHFLRLDEYLSKDSYAYKNLIEGFTTWRGHEYGIVPSGKAYGAGYCTVYNKELLDRLGIDIWEQYVNNDNWNWNTFLEIALTVTQDLNGDGIIDQWGLKGYSEQSVSLAFVASNGGKFIDMKDDGVEYVLHKDPKAVKALQFVSDLYNIYKVTYLGGNARNDMYNGKAAMALLRVGSFTSTYYPDPANASKLFVAPVPKGPDKDEYTSIIHTYFDMMALTNIPGNPNKEVVEVVSELYAETYRRLIGPSDRLVDFVSKVCTSWFNSNPATIDLYLKTVELAGNPVVQNMDLFKPLLNEITNKVLNETVKSGVPVTTKLNETKNLMQDHIDKVLYN